jgi:aquaporin Z
LIPAQARRFIRNRRDSRASKRVMSKRSGTLHWPEYFIEASALGVFMVSAAVFATLLYHPASPLAGAIPDGILRRAAMGLAMGLTAVSIIYSPWGQRSGAHMNPVVTLAFFRLGRVAQRDLIAYAAAQFIGGFGGIAIAAWASAGLVAHHSVNYVATLPGPAGNTAAFLAEMLISFVMLWTVLVVSNHPRLARYTGACAGLLVWTYITIESPLSGMSMNPARSLGSALLSGNLGTMWIYSGAPLLGMSLAADLFARRFGPERVSCAKMHHPESGPCIFGCRERASRTAVHHVGPTFRSGARGAEEPEKTSV